MNEANFLTDKRYLLPLLAVGIGLAGCGGSGGYSGAPLSTHPGTTTTANVASLLRGYGQTVVTTSLTGYGKRLVTQNQILFDPTLGLWYRIRFSTSAIMEVMYSDQGGATEAGSLTYVVEDATRTSSGTFSIVSGNYAGLTGTYFQALNSPGFNGSMSLHASDGTTTDSQFRVVTETNGTNLVTETNGVAEPGGYLQTERATVNEDGTISATTTDSNSCTSKFSFSAALAGIGTISGKYPGLPAKITWAAGGNGTVTYADGSAAKFANWQITG